MVALLFPGQGSQVVGMGKALYEHSNAARQVFAEADEALGFALSKMCFEGPEDSLRLTENTQPALLTVSIAAHRALLERGSIEPTAMAGHSLGEWSALVAADAIDFADAVKLVRKRGQLMQEAVPEGTGAMAAIMGLEPSVVREIASSVTQELGQLVSPANYNSPQQTVVSGAAGAVDTLISKLEVAGGKAKRLAVSAPFHCAMMSPAAEGLESALNPVEVTDPAVPVFANVTAETSHRAADSKRLLVEQVTAPVRWTEIVLSLSQSGETTAMEVGPGRVLAGLARRIDKNLKVVPISDPTTLEAAL